MNMNMSRKRSGSSSKRPKEKVVYLYEQLFRGKPNTENPEFWNEFFLLLPNAEALEYEILKISNETLGSMQKESVHESFKILFAESIKMLNSDSNKRVQNALQTICSLIMAIYKKSLVPENGFEIINTLVGFMEVEDSMKTLVYHCSLVLTSESPDSPRNICLKLLLILVTGTDNVSQNVLLEYVMINSLFDAFIWLLSNPELRAVYGHDTVVLLTLLVNYRKHEGNNPYVVQLSILADELSLNGFGQVISTTLIEFCKQYALNTSEVQAQSWFSSLSSIVGSMFVSDEGCDKIQQIRANNALLLALYEATNLNRNFITTLAHTQTDTSSPPSPCSTLKNVELVPDLSMAPPIIDQTQYPTNLFVALFQYCSIVMQDHKNESSVTNLKLCLLILTCISEDSYANAMMYDSNLTFKVLLHRAPMRHRKLTIDWRSRPQPLATTLLDLLVEFIVSHMMKKFPMELYLHCIGIIHRLLCYQKRCRIRLVYSWKEMWTAFIGLLKFLVCQEQNLIKKYNIFLLATQVVNIFNLFITYGDTFLATTNSYDELYYELNREEKVFSEIHAMVLRYTSMSDCEYKEDALKLLNALVNILAIIKHFQSKIKEWLATQNISTPTEEQILKVVRKNYDLTLKLQDSLDHYDRYAENPMHTPFFTNIVKDIVQNTRKNIYFSMIKCD